MIFLKLRPIGLAYAIMQVVLRFKDDPQLANRLKAREPQAMADLYDRYGRLAYSLIYRVVHDAAAAEDLLQETFLRVWNRISSFDPQRGALGPWILSVARNRAIDYLRAAEGRLPTVELELNRLENPGWFSGLQDSALAMDRVRRLNAAFEKLNPNQRMAIELAYYEGLSQTEMAERLKQPLGTVKTWVRSALKILRNELTGAATA